MPPATSVGCRGRRWRAYAWLREGQVEHPRLLPGVLVPDPDPIRRGARRATGSSTSTAFLIAVHRRPARVRRGRVAAHGRTTLQFVDILARRGSSRSRCGCGGGGRSASRSRSAPLAHVLVVVVDRRRRSRSSRVAVHRPARSRWPSQRRAQPAATPIYMTDPSGRRAAAVGQRPRGQPCSASACVAWGMFVRARRQLVLSLRDRAERAEAEQQLRVEQARQQERARIAREMHDVLAHRISLLSLHAGALEFRPDAPPDGGRARRRRDPRERARRARGPARGDRRAARAAATATIRSGPSRRWPTCPGLIEESRAAGMQVRVRAGGSTASRPSRPPPGATRTGSCRRGSPTRASTRAGAAVEVTRRRARRATA